VIPVLLLGVARPGLPVALAERGMAVCGMGGGWGAACVALAAAGLAAPVPAVAEAPCPREAARLLDEGAADAVCRSDPDALVAARLRALAGRREPAPVLRVGDLVIDPAERRATRGGRPLRLRPREFALLLHLARADGAAVNRARLLEAVWGLGFDPGTNLVAVHASRLRAELHREGPPMLVHARGEGYRLAA